MTTGDPLEFIRANTVLGTSPLVPEINLFLATEITPIWQATEDWMHVHGVAPPFWAFAWPGGQALARHVLDNPGMVAGRRVLDSRRRWKWIAAIACALAGAALVEAAEIDDLARAAIRLNADTNDVEVRVAESDIVASACRWDMILCGDVCYEAPMTGHIMPWLREMAHEAEVWIADPGRAYLPKAGLLTIGQYRVPTSLELEDKIEREVVLYQLTARDS